MSALFDLTGRTAVVTGATGRLGRTFASVLADAGAAVWAVSRSGGEVAGCRSFACDVTSDDAVAALGEGLRDGAGRLDVLVHAAHVGRSGSLATATPADYAEAAGLALTAFQRLLSATRDLLVKATVDGSPSVIAVSSMYGLVSPRPVYDDPAAGNPPYYGAVKAGVVQLARYAAVELGPLGVRVNTLTPGAFPGPGADPGLVARLGAQTPLGRAGEPAELATALLCLASPHSTYLTGANLVVDGGRTAW
ncbi:SDR family NAD(P)-dependent oxidoreductase [Catenuloplanes atrovinosus]|uniref:NAD(P)-dependent dehydrogenase (Short-subunit alcohol dehydrogenase family) n=1 Tax=Catenuloplanes atrovinosus TaxID=137266 RepID=A0AAE3YY22_9ACTN|nr:SDR family oxidoreductase [Catenuloplanes atrovinosus]MDR7280726.1 NAD(P)-dependent dehydrogenase (short-subunit alcohol dehydrogenase family) [Catenuloplanes atrovinosus]